MRKPNGYGSVLKLSGNRRKPYALRITQGWTPDGKQITKYIGYYATRKEAEIALADFNKNPYIIADDITVEELFSRYSSTKFDSLSTSTQKAYISAFKSLEDIYTTPITKLNLGALQRVFDASNKNRPALMLQKALLGSLFDYAIRNEWLPPERKAIITNIDLSAKGNPNAIERKIFTAEEINALWRSDTEMAHYVLILLYTGVRINELLNLKEEDIHLEEQYFDVVESKTKAGIRQVPIADKILPFFSELSFGKMYYNSFLNQVWKKCMGELGVNHTPHDTRHTFISLLTAKEVDARIIKAIVGHSGSGVTEVVYTHIPIHRLLEAVNCL